MKDDEDEKRTADNGVKDGDRPDQQHHWKSLLYD